jgi:hypothetical protein
LGGVDLHASWAGSLESVKMGGVTSEIVVRWKTLERNLAGWSLQGFDRMEMLLKRRVEDGLGLLGAEVGEFLGEGLIRRGEDGDGE